MEKIIDVKNIYIKYQIGDFRNIGLKNFIIKKIKRTYKKENFFANTNISFSLYKGDMLGIVGLNGAGKTTLVKALAGIIEPSEGTIEVNGKIAALLGIKNGFDAELSVKENIFFRCAMLGYSKDLINKKYKDIISFAELEEFEDRLYKQLSNGMKSRLGFSICCHIEPQILILDEALAVGDGSFKRKSSNEIERMLKNGVTGIFVSHSINQTRKICNKILWLDHGKTVAFSDNVEMLCNAYEEFIIEKKLPENVNEIKSLSENYKKKKNKTTK